MRYDTHTYIKTALKLLLVVVALSMLCPFHLGFWGTFYEMMMSCFQGLTSCVLTFWRWWFCGRGVFFIFSLKDLVQIKVLVNMRIQIEKCVFVCSGVPSRTLCVLWNSYSHTSHLSGKHCMCLYLERDPAPSFIKSSPVFFYFLKWAVTLVHDDSKNTCSPIKRSKQARCSYYYHHVHACDLCNWVWAAFWSVESRFAVRRAPCVMWSALSSLHEPPYRTLVSSGWERLIECVPVFCTLPWSPRRPSPPQPYVPTEEEQMAPLPPNPFSELSEQDMDEYRKNVERRQLGLSGTERHAHAHMQTDTHWSQKFMFRTTSADSGLRSRSTCKHLESPVTLRGIWTGNTGMHAHTHEESDLYSKPMTCPSVWAANRPL